MDNLLFKINISYLELAGFRHPQAMAKHQQQQAIVTLPVAGKSFFAAGIQKLLDLIGSQVFSGPFSSGMVHTFCVMFALCLVFRLASEAASSLGSASMVFSGGTRQYTKYPICAMFFIRSRWRLLRDGE